MINQKGVFVKSFFSVYLSASAIFTFAQQQKYLGTKTPYFQQQINYTTAPQDYKPVFVNYTGRHGARFLTSPGADVLIIDVLQQAEKQQALTNTGKKILAQLQQFEVVEKDNYGNITKLGAAEQHDIAARMQQQYSTAFINDTLLIETTAKLRTQQSADAFLSGLKGYDTTNTKRIVFSAKTDNVLRFYDLSQAYNTYVAGETIKKHTDSLLADETTTNTALNVCNKVFIPSFIMALNNKSIIAKDDDKSVTVTSVVFTQAMYDVYCILFAAKEDFINRHFINHLSEAFSKNDLQWLDKLNSAEDFFEKGPATDTLGIQAIISSPLLRNLITSTDSIVTNNRAGAILRFTHAEAISPLAVLMGIPVASCTSNSAYTYNKNWSASQIIPLSANIQWIIYSNNKNYLLKVLLNEKEVALPVATTTYPYYKWSDVKAYYLNKLSSISFQ